MTPASLIRLPVVLACALLFAACGANRSPAQLSPDTLYERGMAAYNAGSYGRAAELLDLFLQGNVGDPRTHSARIAVARARMQRREYVLAAGDFTRLLNESPPDSLQVPARFGLCEAYQRLSPKPQLDQDYTGSAIAYCESVAKTYAGTPEAAQAAEWVRELTTKLAQKTYDTGMFYFKRGAYDAAVVYFNEAVAQFPDTTVAPAALLRIAESYDRIGYDEEAAEARSRLLREYPQSAEARSQQQPAAGSGDAG
ncbi:MAG TPA: outer membrane protein assembly factor BamD [Longimicrobiaceae bacterium]|nr:outer membrane protein assembly factor BamD [Longimicrobiaceae bacterium]